MVLVELQPQVREGIGRIVGVGDSFGAADTLIVVIEFDCNHVIRFLLPILVPRSAGGGAVRVGRRQKLLKLLEFTSQMVGRVTEALREGACGGKTAYCQCSKRTSAQEGRYKGCHKITFEEMKRAEIVFCKECCGKTYLRFVQK